MNPKWKAQFQAVALRSFEIALAAAAAPVNIVNGKGKGIAKGKHAPQQAPLAPWQWPPHCQQAPQASGPPSTASGDIANDAASPSTALQVTADEVVALHDKLDALTAQVTAATASTTLQVAAQPEEGRALHEKIDALTDLVTTAIPRLLALQEKQDAMMLKLEAVMVKLEAMDNTMNQNHTSPETMSQASSVALPSEWTFEQAQMTAPSGEEDRNQQLQ